MQLLMCHYTTNGRLHVVGGRTSVRTPLSPDGQVSEMAGVWHLGDLSERGSRTKCSMRSPRGRPPGWPSTAGGRIGSALVVASAAG